MVALAAVGIAVPLVRRYEARADGKAATLAVLKDQLAEIDGQERAGVASAAEAEALRTELRRRLLAESRETGGDFAAVRRAGARPLRLVGMAVVLALLRRPASTR